jgi:hypothetical protein
VDLALVAKTGAVHRRVVLIDERDVDVVASQLRRCAYAREPRAEHGHTLHEVLLSPSAGSGDPIPRRSSRPGQNEPGEACPTSTDDDPLWTHRVVTTRAPRHPSGWSWGSPTKRMRRRSSRTIGRQAGSLISGLSTGPARNPS